MPRHTFKDPVTHALLAAVEMELTIPEERYRWGRKLGYTDEQIEHMYWQDQRRPKFLDAFQEAPLSQAQWNALERRRTSQI